MQLDESETGEPAMSKLVSSVRRSLDPASLKVFLEDLANEWAIIGYSETVRQLFQ